MLEDREYMRQPEYGQSRVSFTVVLLVVNAVFFLIQIAAGRFLSNGFEIENDYFALSLAGLAHGRVWQLLTFQFMHAGWWHLVFNSIAIYFFGRPVETIIRGRKFLALYFSSGIVGGLVQMLFVFLFPSFNNAVVGASAGASGLVAAFAVMNWSEPFTLFLYFVPVTMRGRTLLWISVAAAVVGLLTPASGIAHAAHLGGILAGFLFARHLLHGNWLPPAFVGQRKKMSFWGAAKKPEADLSAEEFLQKEVDPILEKISAHGLQSLTAREREILQKARSKMNR